MRSTSLEAELPFVCFDDLLNNIEPSSDRHRQILTKYGDKIHKMNPSFEEPERPFLWMTSADAIKFYNEHGIPKKGKRFVFGTDTTEKPEHECGHNWAPDLHDPLPGGGERV